MDRLEVDVLSEDIDEQFAPQRGNDVHTVEVDGEAVLLDESNSHLHHLNPTGALLWACFDGASSLSEIVSDVSDEFRVPYEAARDDALALARSLGREGLLANVSPPPARDDAVAADGTEEREAADPRFVPVPPDH